MRRAALFRALPVLVAFLFTLALACYRVSDPDLYFHLAFGKLLWSGSFPTENAMSFTWGSYPWKNAEWLFGAIVYQVHAAGAEAADSVFVAIVAAAAFALTVDTMRRRLPDATVFDWLRLAPFLVAAVAASQFRFVPRPHLMTFLGLALLLNLWERKSRFLPLWFGAAGCLWANVHPGVIFGLAVCAAFIVHAALSPGRRDFGVAVRAALGFVIGSLANPFFLYPYVYSASHLFIDERVVLAEFMRPLVGWHAPFFFLGALALLAIPARWLRRDYLYVLLVAGFLPLCFFAARIVPKFLLLALPGMCQTGFEIVRSAHPGRRRAARVVLPALGVCALVLAGRQVFLMPLHDPRGWGINEARLPVDAADLIASRGLQGRMYNDFQQGSYLMWRLYPAQRVFQDGRNFAYPAEFLREVVTIPPQEWPAMLQRYGIDIAVLGRGPHDWTLNKGGVLDSLGWMLVQADGVSLVYVRPGSADDPRVRDLALRRVRPWLPPGQLDAIAGQQPREVHAELSRLVPERFYRPMESYTLGSTAMLVGDLALGERFLRAGLANNPKDPNLTLALAVDLERQGRRADAVAWYQTFEALQPASPEGMEFARKRREALAK
ncbi:MAG TPA: hypothetical protein VI078_02240 [bacterium]